MMIMNLPLGWWVRQRSLLQHLEEPISIRPSNEQRWIRLEGMESSPFPCDGSEPIEGAKKINLRKELVCSVFRQEFGNEDSVSLAACESYSDLHALTRSHFLLTSK